MPATWTELAAGMLVKQYEHILSVRVIDGDRTLKGYTNIVDLLEVLDYGGLVQYASRAIDNSNREVKSLTQEKESCIERQRKEDAEQPGSYDFSAQIAELQHKIEAENADRIHWTAVREAFDAMSTAFGGSS